MRGLSQGAFSILWLMVIEALNPVSTAQAVILEYAYKGDFENYISRFNDDVSQTAFEESLFLNIDGCTAVTLQNGSVLILVIDGSLGSIVYSVFEPDASDELEICGFGNYHGAGGGSFAMITDIAADKWGNIAISESNVEVDAGEEPNDRIQVFRLIDGEVVWQRIITDIGLSDPAGICIGEMNNSDSDEDNLLFIADARNHRIVVTDMEGNVIGTYYQEIGEGALQYPNDIEWQSDATQNSEIVYVVDVGNQRIVKLQGALDDLVYQYQAYTSFTFPEPTRLCLDQFGQLYVLDSFNARICKFRDTGSAFEYLTHTAGFGTGSAGLLCYPNGIAMAKGFPHIIVTEQYASYSGAVMFVNDLVITLESVSNTMIDPTLGEASTIDYKLTEYAIDHTVKVYNSQDQIVRTLLDEAGPVFSGEHSIVWNGKDDQGQFLPEGVYTVRIQGQDPYNVPGATDIFNTPALSLEIEIRPQTVYITANTQWDGTHTIYRNLQINPDVTLTLQPGTILECRENSLITVLGTLVSNGTEDNPITIGMRFPRYCGHEEKAISLTSGGPHYGRTEATIRPRVQDRGRQTRYSRR